MDGFHVEGMAEDKLDTFLATEIGEPVPGKHAFHADYQVVAERRNRLEKVFRRAGNVAMQKHIAFCIQDAEKHFSGMKVDSAVVFVCFRVESHV